MEKTIIIVVTIICVVLLNSCGQSFNGQVRALSENNISSMSDEEKQVLLENRFKEWKLPSGIYCLSEDSLFEDSIVRNSIPTLIPTSSDRWIYGYFETDLDSIANKVILCYDMKNDTLMLVQPSVIIGEMYVGASLYIDYKSLDNHLYLIHKDYRRLNDAYQPYTIFSIDVRDGTIWYLKEFGGYGDKTEFVGDKIKAQVFYEENVTEEWPYIEYADSIRWINIE